MTASKQQRSQGFTIVELMIATAVFSVLLIVITVGILQVSRVYYKGVTESNTQNTARSIMDTVAQAIQFSGGDVTTTVSGPTPGNTYAFCVGNAYFRYIVGRQLADSPGSGQTYHAFVQDNTAGCDPSSPASINQATVSGRELLAPNMRLSKLDVTAVGANLYRVEVRVVYGDDDLLQDPNGPGARCISATQGTQFCAVSNLSTVVTKRVQ